MVDSSVLLDRDVFLDSFKDLKGKELFSACSSDPAVFARYMLGVKLYGWQWLVTRRIVLGDRRIILNTSRQIGKSMLSSILALWWVTFNKGSSSDFVNTKVGIISATESQSSKVMRDIKNLIKLGDDYCRLNYSKDKTDVYSLGLFSFLVDDSKSAQNNNSTITFRPWNDKLGILLHGSKVSSFIKSYPPTDIVRGETFDLLFVDEAAQIDDEIYHMAISKTGDKYNAFRIIASTPFGMSGFFYELFDPDGKIDVNPWVKFCFTIDSIKDDEPLEYSRRMEDVKLLYAQGKHQVVRQENYCEFVQSESSYFDPEKVDGMLGEYVPFESFEGSCDMGIDFGGQKKSQTVITISTLTDDGLIQRLYCHAYPVRQDMTLIDDVELLLRRFNVQRIIVDDCPEGDHYIQIMNSKGWTVVGMKFGAEKIKKYGEFRAKLNKGLLKTFNDPTLIGQMKALMQMQGVERMKIQPPTGYGDDFVDSFLMSTYFYIPEAPGFRAWDWDDVDIEGKNKFLNSTRNNRTAKLLRGLLNG